MGSWGVGEWNPCYGILAWGWGKERYERAWKGRWEGGWGMLNLYEWDGRIDRVHFPVPASAIPSPPLPSPNPTPDSFPLRKILEEIYKKNTNIRVLLAVWGGEQWDSTLLSLRISWCDLNNIIIFCNLWHERKYFLGLVFFYLYLAYVVDYCMLFFSL